MHFIINEGEAKIVVATKGKEGSFLLEKGTTDIIYQPIFDINEKVVDSNGAGDSYVSAFLHGYLNANPLTECMKFGTISGAYNCIHDGPHEHFINKALLTDYLKKLNK